ncbi:hypothetical protein [Achromobacter sp. 2789STDY5608633]|uniref:hypothetical protein n=1 Tax=Achromobacter sp. 2789STDY5608633 TaxID=1806501 RepID=UPI0006C85BA4|nr:hypothetical protein [Achromobacter sp. 2789STDY5608633]
MHKKIIYPRESGGICVVVPADGMPLEEIARKDVPGGVPYLIVEDSDLPADQEFRDAWEADFSNPHGHGIGADAWFQERGINLKDYE